VPGEISVFYDDSSSGPDLSNALHMAAGPNKSLFVLDGGTLDAVLAFDDGNGDGDALDEGEVHTFYDASAGGPKLSTPNTLIAGADGAYYIADDSKTANGIVWIKDLDGNGDALGVDEAKVVYDGSALSLPLLEDIEALAWSPNGTLFAGDTTLAQIYALRDTNGDGDFLDAGEAALFYQGSGDLLLVDVETLVFSNGALYACSKKDGRIFRLEDRNGDGDAEDAGEAVLFLGKDASLSVGSAMDATALPGGGLLVLDNSKDSVLGVVDSSGDGDALDPDEVFRWLADDGSTFSSPSGLVLGPRPVDPPVTKFIRGDSTADGKIDISDPVSTLGYLFLGKPLRACIDSLDSDDSGTLNISDAVYLLNFLFSGTKPPPPPFPAPGGDPTADTLSC
jgi:hypothetical protein